MSENLEGQVVYWRQKINSDPAMLDQVIRAMLLARRTQAKAESKCKQLLAAVPEYASYYAAAWEAFEADSDGPEPLDFAEWLAQQDEVQP